MSEKDPNSRNLTQQVYFTRDDKASTNNRELETPSNQQYLLSKLSDKHEVETQGNPDLLLNVRGGKADIQGSRLSKMSEIAAE